MSESDDDPSAEGPAGDDTLTAEQVHERIRRLARRDGRYAVEAFGFVSDAVQATARWLRSGKLPRNDPAGGRHGRAGDGRDEFHVSGQELLAGAERLARARWGMLADRVLASWGLRVPRDIGEIVFLMVEDPVLPWRKRPCDTRDDFNADGDFTERLGWWDDEAMDGDDES